MSKSTIHKDLTEKLPYINNKLAKEVRKVLNIIWDEKYLHEGLATKKMYEEKKRYKEAVWCEE